MLCHSVTPEVIIMPRYFRAVLVVILAVAFHISAVAQLQKSPLELRLDDVCQLLSGTPPQLDEVFSASFLKQVPPEALLKGVSPLVKSYGECKSIRVTERKTEWSASVEAESEGGFIYPMSIDIEPTPPHKITGLFIHPPRKKAADFGSIVSQLKELDGQTSLCVMNISKGTVVAHKDTSAYLPIGSTFKLYVLGALVEAIGSEEQNWDDVITLDSNYFSLPSGVLQSWPHGSPVTLHTLAAKMISVSDNTATDHLIHHLERGMVENVQASMGHSAPSLNKPFLTTRDMFALKFSRDGKPAEVFAESGEEQRRNMLRTMTPSIPLDSIEFNETVILPDKVEWFARTTDLCRAMDWLRKRGGEPPTEKLKGVLSINHGLDVSEKEWQYIGYKGGSESGVVNMTFVLQSNGGEWYAVSASWMDAEKAVDITKFSGIVSSAIKLLEKK